MRISIGEYQIRSMRPDDAPALAKYANNRKIWLNLSDRLAHPYGQSDADDWIRLVMGQQPEVFFAIANDSEAIGNIGVHLKDDVYRRSAEVGYWLGEPFWGQGIATRVLKVFTEFAMAEYDLVRLYAYVFDWNPASGRVLEKAGYQYEGRLRKSVTKDGHTLDELLYSFVRD